MKPEHINKQKELPKPDGGKTVPDSLRPDNRMTSVRQRPGWRYDDRPGNIGYHWSSVVNGRD